MNFKKIYVDIRVEHELLEKYMISVNENILVLSIPMRIIFANLEWMNNQHVPIIIVCRTGHRSRIVKETYFSNNQDISSLEGGINGLGDNLADEIKIVYGKGGYGLQQYIQLIEMLFC